MTQGIRIKGKYAPSKKAVKEALAAEPSDVSLVATSFFGNEYDGPVTEMPIEKMATFVGPDEQRRRNFFGNITRKADGRIILK